MNVFTAMFVGTIFGNVFPFPSHWWKRIQTPVGVLIAGGVAYVWWVSR